MQKGIFGSNAFINNKDVYNNYLYFPHRFRKVKYNYDVLTDFTYRNIKDKIVPLLQQLYIKANYNKDTKKMFKALNPLFMELYHSMKRYFNLVNRFEQKIANDTDLSPANERHKRIIMNDMNSNVDFICGYISNMINKLNVFIEDDLNEKFMKSSCDNYFVTKIDNFNNIRIINELESSKLKKLFDKYK